MSVIASNNQMHPNFNKYHIKKSLLTVWFNFNIAHDEEYIRDLQILGREGLRVRDFLKEPHRAHANWRHFGGKNVISSSFQYEVLQINVVLSKQVKNTVAVWHFSIKKKAQLPAIRITEQPILLTKRKIVCVINVLSIFAKNGESNLVVVLVLESKQGA